MILPLSRRRSSASAQLEWQGQHALSKLALFSRGRSLVQVGVFAECRVFERWWSCFAFRMRSLNRFACLS